MSGNRLLADTNIALYLLEGDKTLATLLDGKSVYVSFISQLELLGFGRLNEETEQSILQFLDQCTVIDINSHIKQEVIGLRKKYSVKLPDAIIMASAIYLDIPLLTSDSDFKKVEELELLYYEKTV
jgi:predicted nucleic acid-binding protein